MALTTERGHGWQLFDMSTEYIRCLQSLQVCVDEQALDNADDDIPNIDLDSHEQATWE